MIWTWEGNEKGRKFYEKKGAELVSLVKSEDGKLVQVAYVLKI